MNNTLRYIQWYDKATDSALGREELKEIELAELQKLFNVPPENPMYDSWEVEEEHLETLKKHLNHSIDLNLYDYFIEASSQNNVKNT